jgi:hypothetical protein
MIVGWAGRNISSMRNCCGHHRGCNSSHLKVHIIGCHLKKLLLAVASIGVFTLNGVSPIQLVAMIAFSAGVYAGRSLPATSAPSNRTMEHDHET